MDKQLTRTDVTSKSKVLTPTGQSDQIGYYGGFVSRAVAFFIDLFIIAGTIATVGFLYQNFVRFIGIGPGLISSASSLGPGCRSKFNHQPRVRQPRGFLLFPWLFYFLLVVSRTNSR